MAHSGRRGLSGRDGSTGGPVSTPAIASGVVYALGPHGKLVAVQLASGTELWKRQIEAEVPHWGFTTSPLVAGDVVIVLTGGAPDHAITAFNKQTGAVVWSVGTDVASYQSPMLASLDGRERVLVGGDQYLFALDPATGREVWRYEHGGRGFYAKIVNPVSVGRDGFLITYRPDESVLLKTASRPEVAWSTRELKLNYATPVVSGERIFGYSGAFLTAIDARTGTLAWRSRPPGDGFPILVDGHLVVLTKRGILAVAATDSAGYEEKASIELFTRLAWTPPSFAEGRIFARDSYAEIAAVDVVPLARMTTNIGGRPRHRSRPRIEVRSMGQRGGALGGCRRENQHVSRGAEADLRSSRVIGSLTSSTRALLTTSPCVQTFSKSVRKCRCTALGRRISSMRRWSFRPTRGSRISSSATSPRRSPIRGTRGRRRRRLTTARSRCWQCRPLTRPRPCRQRTSFAGVWRITRSRPLSRRLGTSDGVASGRCSSICRLATMPTVARRYPVLYVLYGEEMKDAHLDAVLDDEIGTTVKPLIAVFLESTSGYEYARTFREAHRRMLTETVVKWTDSHFRTLAEPQQRFVLGNDEAGFGALETTLLAPQVFGGAAMQSIFPVGKGDEELLALIDRTPKSSQRFYLNWGKLRSSTPRRQCGRGRIHGCRQRPPAKAWLSGRFAGEQRRIGLAVRCRSRQVCDPRVLSTGESR